MRALHDGLLVGGSRVAAAWPLRCSEHAWRGCAQAEELDEHWIDFLAVVKNMETGAKLRFGTPQESLEEFRIESGAPMPSES